MVKIKIRINLEIILFIIIFIITKQINIYAVFIVFSLVHEMSHALAGILCGFKIKKIEIMPFGFKITFGQNRNKIKKIFIALAGPFSNFMIMMVAIIFKWHMDIIYANLIIAIFNLIPIYPLDGGKILKLIIGLKKNFINTTRVINKVSNITIIILTIIASIAVLYIKNLAIVVAVIYLWYIVIRENRKFNLIQRVYKTLDKPLAKPKNIV